MADDFIHDMWTEGSCTPKDDPWVEASGSIAGLLSAINEHFEPTRGTTACLLYEHELSTLFKTREAMPEFLCNLYDGRTIQRNLRELQKQPRSGRGVQRADRVYLPVTSGLFATTDEALGSVFTRAMRHGGLFSRLWWIKPLDLGEIRPQRSKFTEERDDAIAQWVAWLAGLTLHDTKVITCSKEAWDHLDGAMFFEYFGKRTPENEEMHGTLIRAADKVQIIAGLFALFNGRMEIQVEDARLAVQFMRILVRHAHRFADLGASELVRDINIVERMALEAGEDGLSRKDIYRRLHCDKRTVETVIDTLLDRGSVVEDKAERATKYVHAESARARELAELREKRTWDPMLGPREGNVIDLTGRLPRSPDDTDSQ